MNQLEFAEDGAIWLCCGGSIYRYNNGEIKFMDDELKIPPYTGIEDIVFDSEGTIWLATNRGLDGLKMEILNFSMKQMACKIGSKL